MKNVYADLGLTPPPPKKKKQPDVYAELGLQPPPPKPADPVYSELGIPPPPPKSAVEFATETTRKMIEPAFGGKLPPKAEEHLGVHKMGLVRGQIRKPQLEGQAQEAEGRVISKAMELAAQAKGQHAEDLRRDVGDILEEQGGHREMLLPVSVGSGMEDPGRRAFEQRWKDKRYRDLPPESRKAVTSLWESGRPIKKEDWSERATAWIAQEDIQRQGEALGIPQEQIDAHIKRGQMPLVPGPVALGAGKGAAGVMSAADYALNLPFRAVAHPLKWGQEWNKFFVLRP